MLFEYLIVAGEEQGVASRMSVSDTVVLDAIQSRAKMAHIRQSRPDSGLGVQAKVLIFF